MNSLPGLPEELILEFLARLPKNSRHTASLVCHKWLHILESRQFYVLRKQLGHVSHLACFLQPHPPISTISSSRSKSSNPHPTPSHVITVFDPVTRHCRILPPIPKYASIVFDDQSEIVSTEGKLIWMNQTHPKNLSLGNSIFVFDFSSGHWRQGKDLPIRSHSFAIAAAPDGRVFVAGGFNPENMSPCSGWMYDVRKDEWSELPPMDHSGGFSRGDLIENRFYVSTLSSSGSRIEIYDLESGQWEIHQGKKLNDCPYVVYTKRDRTMGSSKDYNFKFYKLPLGDRTLVIGYQKGNLDEINYFGMQEEGKIVRLPVPDLFCGNLYSMCCVEVH